MSPVFASRLAVAVGKQVAIAAIAVVASDVAKRGVASFRSKRTGQENVRVPWTATRTTNYLLGTATDTAGVVWSLWVGTPTILAAGAIHISTGICMTPFVISDITRESDRWGTLIDRAVQVDHVTINFLGRPSKWGRATSKFGKRLKDSTVLGRPVPEEGEIDEDLLEWLIAEAVMAQADRDRQRQNPPDLAREEAVRKTVFDTLQPPRPTPPPVVKDEEDTDEYRVDIEKIDEEAAALIAEITLNPVAAANGMFEEAFTNENRDPNYEGALAIALFKSARVATTNIIAFTNAFVAAAATAGYEIRELTDEEHRYWAGLKHEEEFLPSARADA